jgi:hypothetical protein
MELNWWPWRDSERKKLIRSNSVKEDATKTGSRRFIKMVQN